MRKLGIDLANLRYADSGSSGENSGGRGELDRNGSGKKRMKKGTMAVLLLLVAAFLYILLIIRVWLRGP